MKGFFVSCFLITVLSAAPTFAQFKKGTVMVGGGLSGSYTVAKSKFGSTTRKDATNSSFSFSPQVGYFILDNVAVGVIGTFNAQTEKQPGSTYKNRTISKSGGVFARYYYEHFFAHGEFQLARTTNQDVGDNGPKQKTNGNSWKLGVGYAWLIGENIAIEPLLGYGSVYNNLRQFGAESTKTPGIFFRLGFQVYLNR